MKRLSLFVFCLFLSSGSFGADYQSSVNTFNGQAYNQSYRDAGDGTNGITSDVLTANTYSTKVSTAAIKTTGGYLEGIQVWKSCAEAYVIQDGTTTTGTSFGVTISTIPASFTQQYIPYKLRFVNGLTLFIPAACTSGMTASYR